MYEVRLPIEIDENEMPESIRSDFTTRSKKRRKILDQENTMHYLNNKSNNNSFISQTDENLIRGQKMTKIPKIEANKAGIIDNRSMKLGSVYEEETNSYPSSSQITEKNAVQLFK